MKHIQIRRRPKRGKEPEPEVRPEEADRRQAFLQGVTVPEYFVGSGEVQPNVRSAYDFGELSAIGAPSVPGASITTDEVRLPHTTLERTEVLEVYRDLRRAYMITLDKLLLRIVMLLITGVIQIAMCITRCMIQPSPRFGGYMLTASILMGLLFLVVGIWFVTGLRDLFNINTKFDRSNYRLSHVLQRDTQDRRER